ncbi:hypothetical protein [Streptomyces syringium]|uniref:hypothetical protein n=1 Tax=Streptomyces syringium TaxID=76729 RepID=UPI003AAAC438
MNTTTAAETAKVTVATIRTWCRLGAIAATKTAGRWVIDTTSLKHRIRLGKQQRRATQQRQATAARTRILNRLVLPALTGSAKQIAWAEELRASRIDQALTVAPHRRLGIAYHLTDGNSDPLGITYIRELAVDSDYGTYRDEAAALTALTTAVTTGPRTTASWWINNRNSASPF